METKQLNNGKVEIWTNAAHVIRKKGDKDPTDIRRRRINVDELDQWEEIAVSDIPPYTKSEYDKKVAEFVREKYTADEEFALQRKVINATMSPETISEDATANKVLSEYQAYNSYVQECKERAKDAALYVQEEPEAPDVATDAAGTEDQQPENGEGEINHETSNL